MSKKTAEASVKVSNARHPFSDPENNAGFVMWQVSMLWQRKLKAELDKLGLTHAQFLLLAALDYQSTQKKVVSQQDLATHCRIDKMMTSKILRIMQKKGFITRRKNKMDTRSKTLVVSEEGEMVLKQALKAVDRVDGDFVLPLGLNAMSFQDDMRMLLRTNS
ncbi:MAG: MarR family transcriptional regulator [Bacteroidetes bacterium]|nr:MarR family transcriptional regulator [Bacteroidota bacterium]